MYTDEKPVHTDSQKLCAEKQKAMYINLMTTVANETVSGQLLHIFHFSFPVTFTQ